MPLIIGDLAGLSLDTPVLLCQLYRWNTANLTQVYAFTNQYGITFGGLAYDPLAFDFTGKSLTSGTVPTVQIEFSDQTGSVTNKILSNRVTQAQLYVYLTLWRYCDGKPSANSTKSQLLDIYTVARADTFQPRRKIIFDLVPEMYRLRFPHGRRASATCSAVYKSSNCTYVGAIATCTKRVTGNGGCEGHFPTGFLPAKAVGFQGSKIMNR